MKKVHVFLFLLLATVAPIRANAFWSLSSTSDQYENCTNSDYSKAHPDKCPGFLGTTSISILSGAAILGGTIALIGMSNTDTTPYASQTVTSPINQTTHPTLPTNNFDMVGGDIDSINLASVTSTPEYSRNFNQYNEIRLGYSLARGYTGHGSTIAILDAGMDSWHGATVASIASGPIAPNAIVKSYKIANNMNFVSYHEIGNTIASAHDANIFNASWSVPMRANDLRSRQQLINLTDKNFTDQLSNAAARDAIFVWAAGNDSDIQSSALSAIPVVMPEMRGHFVNVVAWDTRTGKLADYSNACGITSNWCITAPGTKLDTGTAIATGTSFATPIVSAAIAVIREAFPYMTAPEITSLLFETARDLGEPGIDAIYGHGMLDLERATRPVGAPLIPLDGTNIMQPLQSARISGAIAHNIKNTNPQFAYFDKYGRAFNTDLSNIISVKNRGIGLQRLRQDHNTQSVNLGNLELGMMAGDIIVGDGLLQTNANNLFTFIGAHGELEINNKIKLFHHTRISFGKPTPAQNSMINNFSNIYTSSLNIGAQIGDITFGLGIPDTIVYGDMNLHLPIGRATTGAITYKDYNIDMRMRPSLEYFVSYKSFSAGFVDNPYGRDEVYILTHGHIVF